MDRVCFSRQLFLDFFGQVQRGIGAGEQEYLFFFAQRGQELDGFFLALFVEADEDVVEDERHRFDLFGEGHGQADADGQVNLVAQAAAPLFFRDAALAAIDGKELFAVQASLQGIAALGHEIEVFAGLADDDRLADPFVVFLGLFQHVLGVHIGQPVVDVAVQFGLAVLFGLQELAVFVALGHLAQAFNDTASFFCDFSQFLFGIGDFFLVVVAFICPGLQGMDFQFMAQFGQVFRRLGDETDMGFRLVIDFFVLVELAEAQDFAAEFAFRLGAGCLEQFLLFLDACLVIVLDQ